MRPSPELIAFIRAWERPTLLPNETDTSGIFSIGHGHRCASDHPPVTPSWVEKTLLADARKYSDVVEQYVTTTLSQNEHDAVTSLCASVGMGRPAKDGTPGRDGFVYLRTGQPSTMRSLLNRGDFENAALEFERWIRADGKVVKDLQKRRAAEKAMFLEGRYDMPT